MEVASELSDAKAPRPTTVVTIALTVCIGLGEKAPPLDGARMP
jgi:hypothetical protein